MNSRFLTYRILALLVAFNYFAFRVELCEEEYRQHHPGFIDDTAFARTTLTWETFDKDNAPQAFFFNAEIAFHTIAHAQPHVELSSPFVVPCQPVRDKSPPVAP